jgi:hypothetical protein
VCVQLAIEWVGLATVSLVLTLSGRYLAFEVPDLVSAGTLEESPGLLPVQLADAYVSIMFVLVGSLLFVASRSAPKHGRWRVQASGAAGCSSGPQHWLVSRQV